MQEIESWNRAQKAKCIFQANVYNFVVGLFIAYLIGQFVIYRGIQYDLIKSIVSAAVGVSLSVAVGIVVKGPFGVALAIAFAIAWAIGGGIVYGGALGVAEGAFGVVMAVALVAVVGAFPGGVAGGEIGVLTWRVGGGVVWGAVVGVAGGLAGGVELSISALIVYFIVWSRWFYLPTLLVPVLKKIHPHRLPFHWDENVSAPLPFVTQTLLRISRYNRTAAIDEAIFLIRERPSQRKAAQRALMKIAIAEMLQFRDVRNIANLRQELAFLPQDNTAFPEFYQQEYAAISTFATDARTALAESNASNRLRLLERLDTNIQEFQKHMDFAKKDIGIPFGQIARRWVEIVQKEIKQIEADVGRPLPNPFIAGRPIDASSEMFIGRKDIIEQIQHEALREGGSSAILFIGNRRTGKTSTLLNLRRYLLSSLKSVFVDCQDPTISSSITDYCRTIGKAIATTLEQTRSAAAECNSLADLTEFLKSIQQHLQQANQHLLICFDEYERLTEKITDGDFADLPNTFRYWVQHLPRTICLFSGSHQLDEILQLDWTDYLINVRLVPISYLDFDSALRLVTAPIARFDLQYDPGVEIAERLVHRLGCQPFLLQATMSELVNYLNSLNRKVAMQEDVDVAIERMFRSWRIYFEHIWEKESNVQEREVLADITKQKPMREDTNKALRSLVRKEILRQENGEYVFCVPVFQEWIIREIGGG